MVNIAIFVSGSGSNMLSIIEAIEDQRITNANLKLVISSSSKAKALEKAAKHNIDALVYEKESYTSLEVMYKDVILALDTYNIDLIILAGYLKILTPNIIRRYKNRIINIHPSLIPAYCGPGFYGMNVHSAVIANKESFTGVTVHFVDEGVDTGKIIMQDRVPVFVTDTPESLAERVLEQEHILLPKVVKHITDKLSRLKEK